MAIAKITPPEPRTGLISGVAPQAPTGTAVEPATIKDPAAIPTQQTPISQAAAQSAGDAAQATAQQATVDPATMTVQGQLAGLISSGSPLLVQAQTRAAQEANRRGLLNSSIAVGAGESALYDAAMPIAQADADTHRAFGLTNAELRQQSELANVGAKNQMSQFNVGEANTTGRFNVSEAGQTGRFNADAANAAARQLAEQQQQVNVQNAQLQQQAGLANAENQNKLLLQQMDAQTRVEMTNIEANYRTLMQASESASSLYSQTLKNISDIMGNKDLDAAAKNAAIARQQELLQNGMNLIGSMNNLGISELLNFGPTPASPPSPGNEVAGPTPVVNPNNPYGLITDR